MTCRPYPYTFRGTSQVFLPLSRIVPLYGRVPSEKQAERRAVNRLGFPKEKRYSKCMENTAPMTATLTKVLHAYGNLEVQETMRFANVSSAARFRRDMLNKCVGRPYAGSAYTIIAVEW